MIRQMKYYLIAMSAWNLVRAFLHSFNHGYDVLFELRMLAAVIPLCFAALIVVIEEILKRFENRKAGNPTFPVFSNFESLPPATQCAGVIVLVTSPNNQTFYSWDGKWLPIHIT